MRQCLVLVGACLLFSTPQVAYAAWSVGLPRYVESVVTFGTFAFAHRESWPVSLALDQGLFTDANAAALLLNTSVVVAGIALVSAGLQVRRAWAHRTVAPRESLWILVVVVMWGLMLPMLARGQYYTRVSEVWQPVAILGAWLAVKWVAVNPRSIARWTALGAVLTTTLVALCCRTPMAKFFTSSETVFGGAPFQAHALQELATSPPIDQFAPPLSPGNFQQLVRYAHDCTTPEDRLLVTWFAPQVYVYAGRAFAGDRWSYGDFDNAPDRQHKIVELLRSAVGADRVRRCRPVPRFPAKVANHGRVSGRLVQTGRGSAGRRGSRHARAGTQQSYSVTLCPLREAAVLRLA